MTTATKTRHLHPVPDLNDTPAPTPSVTVIPTGRNEHLSRTYDTAVRAANIPDVQTDLDSDITILIEMLAQPGADLHTLLREFGTDQYVHGYVDAETTREAQIVTAEIISINHRCGGDEPA